MTGSNSVICKLVIVAASLFAVAMIFYTPTRHKSFSAGGVTIESFTLKNGMPVVLFTDDRIPAITHMLWYKVGSADDYPGRTGLAHYNEHMMFQGTQKMGSGDYIKKVTAWGGHNNAFTSRDYTAYYATIAKEHLPELMEMEADRMVNLAPSEENFRKEREVIIEERRMSVENKPGALLGEEMDALLFRNHPYHNPNIGWMHEMQNLSREDVLSFHRQFYHPANAIMVVAGDITRKELEPLAEKYYGTLPAGERYIRHWQSEPPQRGPRHTELHHINVREPEFARVYMAPSIHDAQKDLVLPGFILAQILGGGSSSRLYQSLVVKQKIATEISVSYSPFTQGPGTLEVTALPAHNVSLQALETAIDKELTQAKTTPPTDDEMARAKTLLKAETIYARDGIEGMARMLGTLLMQDLPPSYFLEWPNLVEGVTVQEVTQSAADMINPDSSVTGYLLPKDEGRKEQQP